ncbi:TBC1 domain family member 16 [Biomphalaria pfeifferi]|uniref:TBC1 domain family member 16 n=1 Tax=Biomphalaria pfeifferi TaxID=112525 RepID=A0AAD8BEI9_BIOPF|nr:TBC1 domain family member 16 [Biomphalaria pfeifferi]
MAFSTIFKKASNLLGLSGSESLRPPPLDGEIIYCKNNVCVHPPASLLLETEHHPGYLTLRAQQSQGSRPTLVLTWIPNTTLKKNPYSIESSPIRSGSCTPKVSPRRNPKQEFAKSDESVTLTPSPSPQTHESFSEPNKKLSLDATSICSEASLCSRGDSPSLDDSNVCESKLSCSYKSQTDSGIGGEGSSQQHSAASEPNYVQNNEKCKPSGVKPSRVGIHVNDLNNITKVSKSDRKNLVTTNDQSQSCDELTSEEQLVAMLNRNKLHAKVKETSELTVSIEIQGDKLVVVTEQQDGASCTSPGSITDNNINRDDSKFETSSSQSTDADTQSLSSDSNNHSPSSNVLSHVGVEDGLQCLPEQLSQSGLCRAFLDLQIPPSSGPPPNTPAITPDIHVIKSRSLSTSSSSTTTSGPDSAPNTPCSSVDDSASISPGQEWSGDQPESPNSGSSVGYHNLTFPENAMTTSTSSNHREKRSAREQLCGVFSVDLGQMRSLRLFYNDSACTQGQVVIASRESQYKILHFHNGGLDKLAEIFEEWSLFAQQTDECVEGDKPYKQFLVVKPHLTDDQCHPEEHLFPKVTDEIWKSHMTEDGRTEDVFQLRKAIFFGGLDASIRHDVWPFLLHYFPFDSTFEQREQIRNDKYIEYQNIRKKRESMDLEEQQQFWRSIQCIVEKDVVRTDRSHPYFRGDNNPNIEVLKNILLNYAVANPSMGYTQGMSDLLAPVLAAIQQEVEAYWCFTGLMTRTIFVSSPRDSDMDKQLNYLRELLRVTLPKFQYHLKMLGQDAMELLFCHRWILLCFKREFCEADALRIWEACWARYQTDYFHLFVCVAIVAIYGDDVVEQRLPADEILLHFSSLAMHMNGRLVLKMARGLLHEFRKRVKIPCTLHGLCSQVHAGMWDSGHVPTVECIGHLGDEVCPYNSTPSSPVYGDQ